MKKEIVKSPLFLLGLLNLFMGLVFIFQDGSLARIAAYIMQLNFICLLHFAQKNEKNKRACFNYYEANPKLHY